MARAKKSRIILPPGTDAAPEATPAPAKEQSNGHSGQGNRPVWERRLGNVRVSCWRNVTPRPEGASEVWYSTTLTRSYKNAQGEWKNSTSYGLDNLLVAAELLRQAAVWIFEERQGLHRSEGNGADASSSSPSPDVPF